MYCTYEKGNLSAEKIFEFIFQLLNYAATTILFSDRKVDTNVISWNKVILLHGKVIKKTFFFSELLFGRKKLYVITILLELDKSILEFLIYTYLLLTIQFVYLGEMRKHTYYLVLIMSY